MSHALIGSQAGSYRVDTFLGGVPPRERFLGTHVATGRPMELVVIPLVPGQESELATVLYPQLRALGELASARVVPVEDVFVQDGLLVLVQPPASGPLLADKLVGGPLGLDAAVTLADELLEGLVAAHETGVVHGSLGPTSVVLDPNKGVRLQGFSEVNLQADPGQRPAAVSPSVAAVLAPERWDGGPSSTRADVYAAGLCLYAALTGQLPSPSRASDPEAWASFHRGADMPDVRDLRRDTPHWLANLIWRATRRDPAARFADAREMRWLLGTHREADEAVTSPDVDIDLSVEFEQDPGTDELDLPEPEVALQDPVDPGDPGVSPIADPLPPEENEWAFDQPTAVGTFAEATDPGAAPPAPAGDDNEWALHQPTAVGQMPVPGGAAAGLAQAPPVSSPPPAASGRRKRKSGGGLVGALSGCGLVGVAATMGVCAVLCAVGYESGWFEGLLETGEAPGEPIEVEAQPVEIEAEAEVEGAAEGSPEELAEDTGGAEAAAEGEVEEEPEEAEEPVSSGSSGSSGSTSSGSSSSGGRSSGRSSGSSSSGRSGGASSSGGSQTGEPEGTTELPASGGGSSVEEEKPDTARLVIMLTAKKRKTMKGAVIILDEERLGSPPQSVDVSPGTHMVEWRGDGWVHICPIEVPSKGKTVKMDLEDGECPW